MRHRLLPASSGPFILSNLTSDSHAPVAGLFISDVRLNHRPMFLWVKVPSADCPLGYKRSKCGGTGNLPRKILLLGVICALVGIWGGNKMGAKFFSGKPLQQPEDVIPLLGKPEHWREKYSACET